MKKFMYDNFKMLLNVTTDEEVTAFIADTYNHTRLVRLTMQWITYSYPCLPFDEQAEEVRKNAWKTCLDYANIHGLKLPEQPQCLDEQAILFFNK